MYKFNQKRNLEKIRKRNKITYVVIALLTVIGSSYMLTKYNKRITSANVESFYQNNVSLSLYIDGVKKSNSKSFPEQSSGKIFSHITCENGSTGVFDNTKWELSLNIKQQDKCNVYFITGNLPNAPELYQGMIPVVYDEKGNMYVADTSKDWYNYQDHRWANAVLVDASNTTIKNKYFKEDNTLRNDIAGTEIPMEEVLQMYVWIPRYKYKIFSLGNTNTPKQIIEIAFEKGEESTGDFKCTYEISSGTVTENCPGIEIGKWYTHPAFTFKGTTEDSGTELKGFWVGKFEPSDPTDPNGRKTNVISEITILPDKTSMVNKSVSTAFFAEQKLNDAGNKYNLKTDEVDTRMMKNIEWGATAYLTQSIYGVYTSDGKDCVIEGTNKNNCESWVNNTVQGTGSSGTWAWGGTYTGCVGDAIYATVQWNTEQNTPAKCDADKQWNTGGVKASTTGNMYGIYDMAGGAADYAMGSILKENENILHLGQSGFTEGGDMQLPDAKYYDVYTYDTSLTTHERGHYGDATKEVLLGFGNLYGGWSSDVIGMPYVSSSAALTWFIRGGLYDRRHMAGINSSDMQVGAADWHDSFRSVLSAA